MAIQVGDKIPAVSLKAVAPDGVKDVTTDDIFGGKKAKKRMNVGDARRLLQAEEEEKCVAKPCIRGDTIACLSVNDAFVMDAWAKDRGAGDKVLLLADGNADFTRAVGLELDGSSFGMGVRSQRYALIVEDGVVKHLAVEAPMKFEVSRAEDILAAL